MRKNIVAGNWKMNMDLSEATALVKALKKQERTSKAEIIVAPPFTNLYPVFEALRNRDIAVAAQNMHQSEAGAFTGEVSAKMLTSVGIKTVILGHSERRAYFNEADDLLAEKVNTALDHGIRVIFCFGEELDDRKQGNQEKVVTGQIKNALFHLEKTSWQQLVLAYEPVWAIGTGETASPEQAQEMHAFIRKTVAQEYDKETADGVTILYGGSVKPGNAQEIFSKPDVDGGLIGGASLKAEDFFAIVNAF